MLIHNFIFSQLFYNRFSPRVRNLGSSYAVMFHEHGGMFNFPLYRLIIC